MTIQMTKITAKEVRAAIAACTQRWQVREIWRINNKDSVRFKCFFGGGISEKDEPNLAANVVKHFAQQGITAKAEWRTHSSWRGEYRGLNVTIKQ